MDFYYLPKPFLISPDQGLKVLHYSFIDIVSYYEHLDPFVFRLLYICIQYSVIQTNELLWF